MKRSGYRKKGKWAERGTLCLLTAAFCTALICAGAPAPAAAAAAGNLTGAPTVVERIESLGQLETLSEDAPASVIVTMDAEANAVGADGASLGALADVYEAYIEGTALLIVEIGGEAAADALVRVWNERLNETDMAVMSSDAAALGKARAALEGIRGVYDCSGVTFSDDASRYAQVKNATLAMANVVVLSEEQSTVGNVAYFQGRFKTVWTALSAEHENDAFAVQNIVSSGAYGIVSTQPAGVYRAYREYPRYAVARISRNIAHRGLPLTEAENSVAGAQAAAAAGATHLEIDVHLSADGRAVVMHDDTIDRTTNGSGAVASMTLAQLGRYSIVRTYRGETVAPQPIPTIDDFFEAFGGTDIVIVCEIKSSDPAVLQALNTAIEKYDFWDRIVFISFDLDILAAAHEQLPQVPTASLASFPSRLFEIRSAQYNAINTVVDAAMGDLAAEAYYDTTMKDRGYMSFVWTYDSAQECAAAMADGLYGLTNNDAAAFGASVGALYGQEGQSLAADALDYDIPVSVVVETYAGETSVREGKVFSFRDCGSYAEVIASCSDGENVLFTPAFRVDYTGGRAPTAGGSAGLVIGLSVGGAVLVLGAGCAAFFLLRRKNAKR